MNYSIDSLPSRPDSLAIVTGANTGLGYETTRYLCQKGVKVVMACRNESKAMAAKQQLEEELPDARLDFLPLDLSSLESVRQFADAFRSKYDRLDLLINNAGIMWTPYELSVDGFESQMAANHFGHFLLTSLLLDMMPDTPESRVVHLSSLAHAHGLKRIRFEDIHWQQGYHKHNAYAQTKLACMMFGLELDRRLKKANKSLLSVIAHPGASMTELVRNLPTPLVTITNYTIGPLLTHTPDQGALPTVVAALADRITGGSYWGPQGFQEMKGKPGPAKIHPCAEDKEQAARLWELSEELTGAKFPI